MSALILATGPRAHAGALAEVSHGISRASDNDELASSSPSSPGDDDSSSSSSSSSPSDTGGSSCCEIHPYTTLGYTYGPPSQATGVVSEVYLGAQSVKDSNGALTAEARASYGDFGLGVRGTSFYEQVDEVKNKYLHLDVWWLGAFWRLDHGEKFNVWLELGFTGLNNDDLLTMTGVSGGVHGRRWLSEAISLTGGARHFWFEDDVQANELFAGVQLSIVQFAYRIVDFNVGPPLHGPEVGVLLTF